MIYDGPVLDHVFCVGSTQKDAFVYKEWGERQILMKMVCQIYILCANTVGINQIKNVFMKQLDEDANNKFRMM